MKKLLNWYRAHRHFPLDNRTCSEVFGKPAKDFFERSGLLAFGNNFVDSIEIGGREYAVEFIDGKYIGICEYCDDVELSRNDVLSLRLNTRNFAQMLASLMGISAPVSKIGDDFCLGDLRVGKGYRVFLTFSASSVFAEYVREHSDGNTPIIISFERFSSELQQTVFNLKGKFFGIEECVSLSNKAITLNPSFAEILETPRKKKTSTDLYCWKATGFHQPEMPNLKMLKIKILSTTRLSIYFDGEGQDFDYRDINFLRSETTGQMNTKWTLLRNLAVGNKIEKNETTSKQVSRLNTAFREFFGFPNGVTPFKFENKCLKCNFELTAKTDSRRVKKEVFDDDGSFSDDSDFRDSL